METMIQFSSMSRYVTAEYLPYKYLPVKNATCLRAMKIIWNYILQINNEDAINFYKNFGFDIVETKEQYYKRIEPADAYVLEKRLKPVTDKAKLIAQVNGVNS